MNRRVTSLFLLPLLVVGLTLQPLVGPASAQTVTHIAGGQFHTVFSKSDGSLWTMGYNAAGQLGTGPAVAKTNVPQKIVSSGVGVVVTGDNHSLFQVGNTLWGMGDNSLGQLGYGTNHTQYFPEQISTTGSAQISLGPIGAGTDWTLFGMFQNDLNGPGGFWLTGLNFDGELGDGTYSNAYQPEELLSVPSGYAVLAAAGGGGHTLFVKSDGSLWAMGDDSFGQLGDGHSGAGAGTNVPELIVSNGVTAVAAGYFHSLFLKFDGSLWGMGNAGDGEMGDNTTTNHLVPKRIQTNGVVAIAAGSYHTLFMKSDGSLWGMGLNNNGQLGTGDSANRPLPVQIVSSNVVAIAGGSHFSLFIKSDGSLWGMGNNQFGQLGVGDYANRFQPVEIVPPPRPLISSIAVFGSNVVVAWPTNQSGFSLQSSPDLGPTASWSNVASGVIVSNQYVATNPISGSKMFFRLGE